MLFLFLYHISLTVTKFFRSFDFIGIYIGFVCFPIIIDWFQ
jgi:hypothetical protein